MIGALYSGALRHGDPLDLVHPDGRCERLPVDVWCGPLVAGDGSVLDRCRPPTLDVGCGPGRIVAALAARGQEATGLDVNADAVRLARAAGAEVLRGSVFDALPDGVAVRWRTVLLLDGNIGIGGSPLALLQRVGELLAAGGRVLVEVGGPGERSELLVLRLRSGDRLSGPFPWARLALRDVDAVAAAAGLRRDDTWEEAGRWFVGLAAA